jgi:Holliday junction DNA helicase RuvA
MAVSENDILLYGFETWDELELFKMLITVSGVGPKTAAGILATCQVVDLMKAIGDADVEYFCKIKGVGKKTAQKIIIELKSKIGGLGELNLKQEYPLLEDEVYLSLKQLGFERREIEKVVAKMPKDLKEVGDRLGWCLRNLG